MTAGLVAVSLWGLAPVATRSLVTEVDPIVVLVVRQLLAACIFLPWALPVIRRPEVRPLIRLLIAGVLGMVGYNLPVTIGLQWLPASTAGLLLATESLWVLFIGSVFLAERVTRHALIGGAIALVGTGVLAGPTALAPMNGTQTVAGIALVLLGAAAFGAYTIVLRPLSTTYGAVPATAASTVVGALPYLCLAGTLAPATLVQMSGSDWGGLFFLAVGSSVIGMLLWNYAVLGGGSGAMSRLLYVQPVVSVVGAVGLLGEKLSPSMLAGGALVIVGVVVTKGRRSPRSETEGE